MISPTRHPRVQARVRVLEDHLHPPAHPPQPLASSVVRSCPSNVIVPRGRRVEADDGAAGRALAAARLADEPERLAAAEREADAVDRPDVADVALDEIPSVIGNHTLRSSTASSGPSRGVDARSRSAAPRSRRPPSVLGRRAATGRLGPVDGRALVAGPDDGRPSAAASASAAASSSSTPGGGAATNPSRNGRPAAASCGVGGLWQAIRWVAPARSSRARAGSSGVERRVVGPAHVEPPRAARRERAAERRVAQVGRHGPRSGSAARPRRSSRRGIECSSPTVYGCDGRSNSSRSSPSRR